MNESEGVVDAGDDAICALDALVAEFENEEFKIEDPTKDKIYTVDIANAELYLENKFKKYGSNTFEVPCSSSKPSDSNLNESQLNKVNREDGKLNKKMDMEQKVSIFTDPIFGLRIVNPQISSISLRERMANRQAITINELPRYMLTNFTNDWVVAGVILSKETKISSKTSKPFSIWKLSDLQFKSGTISVMLFQNAHHELWKTPSGMCVALLNPAFIEKKSYNTDIATLSIDSAKKVMILGKSKDFGICKAKKQNGDHCKNFVNLNECDYCIFHVQKEYKSMEHRYKSRKDLPVGKFSALNTNRRILQRDKLIMDTLNKVTKTSTDCSAKTNANIPVIRNVSNQANTSKVIFVDTEIKQRRADLARLKSLDTAFTNNNQFSPEISTDPKDAAKQKAIKMLKKCPVEKVNPNSIRGTSEGKRRAIATLHGLNEPKRIKLEESPMLGYVDILERGSLHKDLVNQRLKQEEDIYFDKQTKKEMMEEKMLNTYKMPCKAVICKDCKYTAFSAGDRCKKERHTLKIIDAVKRYFQCKDCGNRTTTLFKLPKLSCGNCSGSRWERCAMIRDRNIQNTTQSLSIRGDEEKFIGSLSTKLDINLLVPTD